MEDAFSNASTVLTSGVFTFENPSMISYIYDGIEIMKIFKTWAEFNIFTKDVSIFIINFLIYSRLEALYIVTFHMLTFSNLIQNM